MLLIPSDGTDYPTADAVRAAYNAGAQFRCQGGGEIDRHDIVNYTGVQAVTVLYAGQTQRCVVDARRPHH